MLKKLSGPGVLLLWMGKKTPCPNRLAGGACWAGSIRGESPTPTGEPVRSLIAPAGCWEPAIRDHSSHQGHSFKSHLESESTCLALS